MQSFTSFHYERHRPEKTLLYRIVEKHYPLFLSHLSDLGKSLPNYVEQTFEDYLTCGRLEHGFLRVRCDSCQAEKLVAFSCKRRGFCPSCSARRMVDSTAWLMDEILPDQPHRQWVLSVPYPLRWLFARMPEVMGKALSIITRVISHFLIKKAGQTHRTAKTGSVTLIQRFGSALNLNVHFHMLFLDGVYITSGSQPVFIRTKAPTVQECAKLVHKISVRVARMLERCGLIKADQDNTYLNFDGIEQDGLSDLQDCSISYRIAMGPQAGQKVLTLQTLPPKPQGDSSKSLVGKVPGFSLHAGVAARSDQRWKVERLCRYITRLPVSEERVSLTEQGKVRYELKTPYRDGTTHVVFEPLDFISRLAALVPKPRVNMTRFHGVYAPNSKLRKLIIGADKIKVKNKKAKTNDDRTDDCRRTAMTWARRLKRVFNIDISVCSHCGGKVRVIACIEDPNVINTILKHLEAKSSHEKQAAAIGLPPSRSPPQLTLL